MKRFSKTLNKSVACILVMLCASCTGLLDQEPENAVTNANYWQNEKDVESAVFGMHSLFRANLSDANTFFRECRGHIFDAYAASGTLYRYFAENKYYLQYTTAGGTPIYSWDTYYNIIAQANLVIDNVHRAGLPEARHNFYLGQALAIRAYTYLVLVRFWGDVPLVTKSVDTGAKPRTPWQDVIDFAIADAERAAEILPPQDQLMDASGRPIISRQVPGRGTAYAILAHLCAWKASLNAEPELLTKGIDAATHVIEDGEYALVASADKISTQVMIGNSTEGILETDYRSTEGDMASSGVYLAGLCESYPIVPLAVEGGIRTKQAGITNVLAKQLFPDVTDERRNSYFYQLDYMEATQPTTVSGGRAYIQKFRGVVKYASGDNIGRLQTWEDNFILIRLADIILLRAEMRNNKGDTQGAIDDVNLIRDRAKALHYDAATEGTDIKAVVFREREKELLLENHRYYDAIRNGNDYVRNKLRGNFKTLTDEDIADGALCYPINSNAFSNNPLMRQNIYWKRMGVN